MKKSLIFVGILAIGFANAQEGNVGINTDQPKATLDIQPSAENAKVDATTNQGIIIPKLSKARVMAIATTNLVEGTKVYVTDDVTTADTQFIGTGKGFYFYNGTKWVKQLASDTDANSELWAQRDNAGVTETYLKPANDKSDFIGYRGDRKWYLNLGGAVANDVIFEGHDNGTGYKSEEVPYSSVITSDVLPKTSTIGVSANPLFTFNQNIGIVRQSHAATNSNAVYLGNETRVIAKDLTSPISYVYGTNASVDLFSDTSAHTIIGSIANTSVGSDNGKYSKTSVINNIGFQSRTRNFATSTNLVGIDTNVHNYGTATNIIAGRFHINSHDRTRTTTVSILSSIQASSTNRTGATTENVWGASIATNYQSNSTATSGFGIDAKANIQQNATIDTYTGIRSYIEASDTATVTNLYGFKFDNSLQNQFKPTNLYGLYLSDVNRATGLNYSIYTNSGKVRVGDLAQTGSGDRVVYADENGVLKTGGSIAANNGVQTQATMECNEDNRGKMNFVKDITLTGGGKADAFAVCLKGSDGNHYWRYLYGAGGETTGSGNFGTGLQ